MQSTLLSVGESAPWFHCRTREREHFYFDTIAGRYVVLCLFGSAADPASRRLLTDLRAQRQRFDDAHISFFGVSTDPDDEKLGRVADASPGIRFFWDFDGSVSKSYGAVRDDGRRWPVPGHIRA